MHDDKNTAKQLLIPALLLGAMCLAGCTEPSGSASAQTEGAQGPGRPNILLIVADDLGYSDIGAFGSEIRTPTLDQLVSEGVHLQNFYAGPTCSPTRAMLLTGVDNHIAGLGTMAGDQTPDQQGQPGYEGYLNFDVAALPEVLQDAGYHTYITGKWHLGVTEETSPRARGFERSFTLLPGGAGAFANRLQIYGTEPATYREDGVLVDTLPADFYSSAFYSDKMIEYIESNRGDGKPFFAYLAYTSPHWPLQAPEESIERYRGVYDEGYQALREQRLRNARALGLAPEDAELFPQLKDIPDWDSLSPEERAYQARLMEIFAAMVDDVDRHLARVIDYLKNSGQFENTVIFFMADNGPEGNDLSDLLATVPDCCDNSYENLGKPDSYVWYGAAWAQAGNVPRQMFKSYTSEGGIAVPAFIRYEGLSQRGTRLGETLTVKDVMPTLLDLAEVSYPKTDFRGRTVAAMSGRSMAPVLRGEAERVHPQDQVFAFELFGRRAIRQGEWKAVYTPTFATRTTSIPLIQTDQWQLYNLAEDPSEMRDLSAQEPGRLQAMVAAFDAYVADNQVILSPDAQPY